jgi:phosphatidylserine decarboxylase
VNERAFVAALRLLPKEGLSRAVGSATRWGLPHPLLMALLRSFAARYRVDLAECADLSTFRTFDEFFTRRLLPGTRPIAPGEEVVVSPVDGLVSEAGLAEEGRLLQAKGLDYPLDELVGDPVLAERLAGGAYATLYLSPRDYHRIHFPLAGRITGWRYLPGGLWPVNPPAVRNVPRLFCVNERLVTLLESRLGLCAIVAVGATVVGRIRALYDPSIPPTNLPRASRQGRDYSDPIQVEKGAELGIFEMGSTVILLFEPGRVRLELAPGARVRVGQAIGAAPSGE